MLQPLRMRQRSLTLQLLLPRAERHLYHNATRLADTSTAPLPVRDRDGGREGGRLGGEKQRETEKERKGKRKREIKAERNGES